MKNLINNKNHLDYFLIFENHKPENARLDIITDKIIGYLK